MTQDLKEEWLSSPEKEQAKLRILIVDDEPAAGTMVKEFIVEGAIAPQVGLIEMAADGQEALEILEANKGRFNVVLTDGEMPGMNGLDLAEKIKESGQNITVVLISAGMRGVDIHNPERQASVKKNYGIAAILPKPCSGQQLSDTLNKIRQTIEVRKSSAR